jgi:acyl carrier protein
MQATITNRQRYDDAFMKALELGPQDLNAGLIYQSVKTWDSVGHMSMIAALETEFDIMLETEDIIDFSSYVKGVEILAKYQVDIEPA